MAERLSQDTISKIIFGVLLVSFGIPLLIYMTVQLVMGPGTITPDDPAMKDEAVAKRIKPVGELAVAAPAAPAAAPKAEAPKAEAPKADAPKAEAPKAEAKPAEAPAAAGANGKEVYGKTCAACHATGAAGAPKLGDKAAWGPRIAQGNDALYASAIKGKGVMPGKGGNAGLADGDVKAAVDYMVAESK